MTLNLNKIKSSFALCIFLLCCILCINCAQIDKIPIYDRSVGMPLYEQQYLNQIAQFYDGNDSTCTDRLRIGEIGYFEKKNKQSSLINDFKKCLKGTECTKNENLDQFNQVLADKDKHEKFNLILNSYVQNIAGRELIYRIIAKIKPWQDCLLSIANIIDEIDKNINSDDAAKRKNGCIMYCNLLNNLAIDLNNSYNCNNENDYIEALTNDIGNKLILLHQYPSIFNCNINNNLGITDNRIDFCIQLYNKQRGKFDDFIKELSQHIESLKLKIKLDTTNMNNCFIPEDNELYVTCLPCNTTILTSNVACDNNGIPYYLTKDSIQSEVSIFHHELCHYFRVTLEKLTDRNKASDENIIKNMIILLYNKGLITESYAQHFTNIFTNLEELTNTLGFLYIDGILYKDRMNQSTFCTVSTNGLNEGIRYGHTIGEAR